MAHFLNVPLFMMKGTEWNLAAGSITPGQTGSGAFPYLRLDCGGAWVAKFNQVFLKDDDAAQTFSAIRMAARGGVTVLTVPRPTKFQPWPVVDGVQITPSNIPHSDGSFFSDGSGYTQKIIDVVTVGAAAFRDVNLTMSLIFCGPLRSGESFSIMHSAQDWRVYEIMSVEIDGDGNSFVEFDPPLREAVADGTEIEFDQPRCTMRLSSTDAMNFTLETYPHARQNVSFIETFFPA